MGGKKGDSKGKHSTRTKGTRVHKALCKHNIKIYIIGRLDGSTSAGRRVEGVEKGRERVGQKKEGLSIGPCAIVDVALWLKKSGFAKSEARGLWRKRGGKRGVQGGNEPASTQNSIRLYSGAQGDQDADHP